MAQAFLTRRRELALGALACVLLPRKARATAESPVQRSTAALMGTRVDIVIQHADAGLRARALEAAWAEMLRLSEMMSRYRSSSQLSLLARAAGGAPLPVAPELMAVLQQAQTLAQRSEGRFDATVGAYADWHFEPGQPPRLPHPATLLRQQGLVGPQGLQLDADRGTARLARAGMRLDLGGIAKLPILQAGLRTLARQGVQDALINGGGDVLCSGTLQGRPWRVGLRDPRAPQQLLGVLALSGGVVAASGDYERGFELAGHRYHHILDPRSGQPSQGLQGLALVAPSVEAVNGWGAAMMVAGPAQSRRWLREQLPGVQAMLAGPEGVWLSAGLRSRLLPTA
ncbi:UNVERIFIED_ORG: FAD:protein FMN transferase [Shinella sp. XGS7]|nr:FAD:protein FMN transferase [Shinella sp. XGS7]